ncbi:sigma-70 family RNA polymerase sigma factor [Polyangium aurulentum]|uniref:sigma-70 family RNA polymerase sigma factor n=1 Tax=Polyangium aurulentum TaxID=2567896 RepID=UPI0010AEE350|nr:sigma-70 family RNA polymerase sigma factor [Polyangium aurulentum]UQA60033.1 sigma-70 family RNA polymerase sigma factor [Polyangium aurulentum]
MTRAFEGLVREALPVVDNVVRWMGRRLGGTVPPDDLRSHAHAALLEAVMSYDPSRSALSTYVARKVRWAILDGVKREGRGRSAVSRARALEASERVSLAYADEPDEPGVTEDEHEAQLCRLLQDHATALVVGLVTGGAELADARETPEERTSRAELCAALHRAVGTLPDRERQIVERHYFGGEPFDEIAVDLGISKSWASRLHAQAISSLGSALSGRGLSGATSGRAPAPRR